MRDFLVEWKETVDKTTTVRAESMEEAFNLWCDGEWDYPPDIEGVKLVENTIKIEELWKLK